MAMQIVHPAGPVAAVAEYPRRAAATPDFRAAGPVARYARSPAVAVPDRAG